MKIGELAAATSTPAETIRYYEREGLLAAPARSEGNYRVYGATHVERLTFVRHCRSLDMALDEIRSLLRFRDAPEENCVGVNDLLDQHISHVVTRIVELHALEKQLKKLRARCRKAEAAANCGILEELAMKATAWPAPTQRVTMHVGRTHRRAGRVLDAQKP